jgi:hypothetical protein
MSKMEMKESSKQPWQLTKKANQISKRRQVHMEQDSVLSAKTNTTTKNRASTQVGFEEDKDK